MEKKEKVLRINVPFRVLPETLDQLKKMADADSRTPASMFEKLVKDASAPKPPKKGEA